ncbi:DUF370 domain-containing protein [Pseudothermotoga thermarum]|uniref:DUF370 domain-containing protein n=1 Tax=Pseudothermotoga thermarum DSM 5069 TaxID=688269 RepID=F7YVF0_9THEM|nr:DUF370 domain-containing protein [Pseudothermotoga thermarum]AEH50453.1 protein of unknown function DUF370 [Pseudothermotoga thermarum DSM 5069]
MLVQVVKGVFVNRDRVKAIIPIDEITAKNIKDVASYSNKMINLTYGAQARSALIIDSGHILILGEKPQKVRQKLFKKKDSGRR